MLLPLWPNRRTGEYFQEDNMTEPQPRLWTRTFSLLCGAGFTTCMAFYSLLPALPLFLENELHIVGWQAGLIISIFTVSAVFTRMLSGWLLDTYGRRPVYLASLAFFSLSFLGYIFTGSWAALLALRIVHGGLWGLVSSSVHTAVADAVPPTRRGEGIGLFGFFFSIAMAIGPVCAMWAVNAFSYDHLFIFEAIFAAIALTLAFFASYLPAPATRRKLRLSVLVEKSAVPVSTVIFLLFMSYGAVVNWIAIYAKDVPGASAGWFYTCLAVGTGLTRIFSGRVFDRRGPVGVCGVGFGVFILALFLLGAVPHVSTFYVAGMCLGIGAGLTQPVGLAIINSMVEADRRGAANATFSTLFDCGIGAGIFITGALQPITGIGGSWLILGGVVIIAAVLFYTLAWPWTRRQQQLRGSL